MSEARFAPWLACAALAASCTLAGCVEPPDIDVRGRYPLLVQPETVTLPAHFVGTQDPFAGAAAESFDTLISGYLDRGHGPLTVTAAVLPESEARSKSRLQQVRERLIAAGIPASAIRISLAAEGAPDTVTLSYERYDVALPTCAGWTTELSYDFYNQVWPNFGCAMQRNTGLMVADPADLVGRAADQSPDAPNAARVIDDYRAAKQTFPTQTPATEPPLLPIPSASYTSGTSGAAGGTAVP